MVDMTIRSAVGHGKNAEKNRGPAIIDATVEAAAAATAGTTYYLPPLPTNARIHGSSRLWIDDLASTGSPTLDIGIYPVDAQFTLVAGQPLDADLHAELAAFYARQNRANDAVTAAEQAGLQRGDGLYEGRTIRVRMPDHPLRRNSCPFRLITNIRLHGRNGAATDGDKKEERNGLG